MKLPRILQTLLRATPILFLSLVIIPQILHASAADTVRWQGKDWYLHGVNVPWINWGCDFGCGTNRGASSQNTKDEMTPKLQQLEDSNVHMVRWWLFPGNPWQIETDGSGSPVGINPSVYQDIDAALAMAEEHDLYYNFVIFSGPNAIPSSWINDQAQRQKLADTLAPLFARYADNPRLMSWEVFNEPEWDMWYNGADPDNTVDLVRRILEVQRANTPALATMGSATVQIDYWVDMDFDYFSPHWYDNMGEYWNALNPDTAAKMFAQTDKPIVLGEIYAASTIEPLNRYNTIRSMGYAGAWGWSLFEYRTQDKMEIDMTALASFAGQHSDIGPSSNAPAPTAAPTSTPVPTAEPTAVPTATPEPTAEPTAVPTATPTTVPTAVPTVAPGSNVQIYARGTQANNAYPNVQLRINGTVVKTFTNVSDAISTPLSYTSDRQLSSSDILRVEFTNDYYRNGQDRNLIVDKIVVDGSIYETEDPSVKSQGSWNSTSGCSQGYKQSEWLHCNGYFQYQLNSTDEPSTVTITIYAAGTPAGSTYPNVTLQIAGTSVESWTNVKGDPYTGNYQKLTTTVDGPVNGDEVTVLFTNDYNGSRGDRNLKIDKISINNIDYQTEDRQVRSTGTWTSSNGCGAGYKQSEWLHCNGGMTYFAK
ncbi:MAG: carbohydrate-binding domain-containing protein [Patescibacteria group bacterium]